MIPIIRIILEIYILAQQSLNLMNELIRREDFIPDDEFLISYTEVVNDCLVFGTILEGYLDD